MIKVLAHSPIPFDGTSFYRSFGIFPNMSKQLGRNLDVSAFQGGMTWAQAGDFDVLFLQRPMTEGIYKLAHYVKGLGVKIWVDHDDNLFDLPTESRAFFDFDDKVRTTMNSILKLADVITVSTEGMQEVFKHLGYETKVVRNALNTDWHEPVKEHNSRSRVVSWRGSETHVADLIYFTDPIEDAINKTTDVYHFFGYAPWLLCHRMPYYAAGVAGELTARVHLHKPDDIRIYHDNLKKYKPRLMHVPLIANSLNAAKSNIAWIEATYAGAVCIAPDWPEWRMPGVLTYKSLEEYTQLLTSTEDRTAEWKKSMDYIQENLTLNKTNGQRIEILKSLCAHL